MKKIILFTILFICVFQIYGQKKNYLSIEGDANYYYYFIGENNTNNFNYGFSIIISEYINKLKVSSGINYSIKSYDSQGDQFYSIKKREYKLGYLNFPIIGNFEIISKKTFTSSILIGLVFDKIIDYNIRSYYLNGKTVTEDNLKGNQKLGVSLIFGATFSKLIGNRCKLNLSPFINYKLTPESDSQSPNYRNLAYDKLSVGFKIGIEYLFKKSDNE